MKKLIFFAVLCLSIVQISLFISHKNNQHRLTESERFFSNTIFVPYHENAKQYIRSKTRKPTKLESKILNYIPENAEKNRKFYRMMITTLREGNDPFLVKWYYISNNLWEILASGYNNSDTLTERFDQYTKDPKYGGRLKNTTHLKDGDYHGNIPFPLFTLGENTQVFRTGNVVYDLEKKEPVAPEFRQYLSLLNEDNKSHLYVNHMSRGAKELVRMEKIHDLEKNYPAITVITLDKDSNFYDQKKMFQHLYDAEAFKRTFIQRLIAGEGYIWSPKINLFKWENSLIEIIHGVHQKYFNSIPELTIQERQEYIDIAYLEIIKELNHQYQFDSLNVSCKHTIDRAATTLALLYFDQAKDFDQTKLLALALSAPIVYHNRPIHKGRYYRFKSTLERLRASVGQAVTQGVPGQ